MNDLAYLDHATEDTLRSPVEGRHAIDEDAVLTPIFAALRRTRRRPAGLPAPVRNSVRDSLRDPVDEFHRDPLTAPIPVQAFVPAPSRSVEQRSVGSSAHAAAPARGRHHHRDPVTAR